MKLYSTLSGRVEEFVPADGNLVKMYVCGVTPYSATHVGHALSYVVFDTLRRYLEHSGYEVRHIQNFTDIDDKIIRRAQETGVAADALAEEFISDYFRAMDALNIKRAAVYPRATREIPRIIDAIAALIERGHAYPAAGDVYFRVASKDDYGKLSHRTLDSMIAGARIQVDENKEHPMDFVLWKGAKPGEPAWESPWGPGRPGWHIECTAMSLEYLGAQLDIHGGGQDLVFPHHENEIAQSECYTGAKPLCPLLDAQRPAATGRGQDEQIPGQPGVRGRRPAAIQPGRHPAVFFEQPLPQPAGVQRGRRRRHRTQPGAHPPRPGPRQPQLRSPQQRSQPRG